MRIILFMILVFIGNHYLHGQTESEKSNPIEIKVKVWQETEKEYKRFIKKQARLRKKLDKHIETQDLEKLEILRGIYYNEINESEKKGELIPKIRQGENSEIFVESWRRMNDRFKYQIRAHEILNPMLLANDEYYKIAEYLSDKYDKQIQPIKKKIGKAYRKLRKKERKVYLKYNEEERNDKEKKKLKKQNSKSQKTDKNPSKKSKVFSNTKILIMKSEK